MTIIYKPVLIESIEQAEALPIGAVAIDVRDTTTRVAVKHAPWGWWHARDQLQHGRPSVLGFEALMPIEAEEGTDAIEAGEGHFYTRTRYVTPWEEV